MTVLHAYGDDCGTHKNADFCLVLGYIASPRQWKLFRRDWEAALLMLPERADKKARSFHGNDFFQEASWQSHNSPYHGWTEGKADAFLDGLLDTIQRYRVEPIGGATNTADFFRYSERDRRYLTGATWRTMARWRGDDFFISEKLIEHQGSPSRPYFVVFPGFLLEAIRRSGNPGACSVDIWLDRQGALEARALEAFDSFKRECTHPAVANLGVLSFRESHKEPGLQAADLYAYVWHRKLSGLPMSKRLSKALRIVTKKRDSIFVADRNYFANMLSHAVREHADAAVKKFRARS